MIYKTFEQWMDGNFLEVKEPRKKAYSKDELLLVEMGWNYGYDAGRAVEQALDKKAENARALGLDYGTYAEELEQPVPRQSGMISITVPAPVAYLCENAVGHKYFRWKKPSSEFKPIALYTTPPAAPVQEPVATLWQHGETGRTRITMPGDITDCDARWFKAADLYTTPPAAPVQEPEVSWGVDWAKAGDKSCATIIKRLPNGKIEVVAVEYEP